MVCSGSLFLAMDDALRCWSRDRLKIQPLNSNLKLIRGLIFNHAKTNLREFAHRGSQSCHGAFTVFELIECFNIGIAVAGDNSSHTPLGPHARQSPYSAARYLALPPFVRPPHLANDRRHLSRCPSGDHRTLR